MKVRVFQSEKGDCLLLTSQSGANVLVDGGMESAFTAHVRPHLAKMAKKKEVIDLVYVSHIDQDHIDGILRLLDDTMAWRVYDYRAKKKLAAKEPDSPRMPVIKRIWHNAFSMMLDKNAARAGDLLAQSSGVLALSSASQWQELADENQELATSIKEAIQVSQRVGPDQLKIPLNKEFDGRLIMVRNPPGPEAKIGGMSIRVIGPFEEDLDVLKDEWNEWLLLQEDLVAKLKAKAQADAEKIGSAASGLASEVDTFLAQLGSRSKVTAPNLASLMLLVEENGTTCLLTGDGHSQDIIAGLEHHGAFDAQGVIDVDVLKVQHHGSEHNIEEEFCRRIRAKHYVFCGNGKHENPDLRVVKLLFDANAKHHPNHKFKVWFNSSAQQAPVGAAKLHMRELEKQVATHVSASNGKATAAFLNDSSFELKL